MSQRAIGPVGEDLLDDGVVAVLLLSWGQLKRGVGEHRVVPPGREQLALAFAGLGQVADPAHDQPGGDGLALLRGERRIGDLGDLGVGDPGPQLVIPDRPRVADGRPGILGIAAIAAVTAGSIRAVTEKYAPARRHAAMNAAL